MGLNRALPTELCLAKSQVALQPRLLLPQPPRLWWLYLSLGGFGFS